MEINIKKLSWMIIFIMLLIITPYVNYADFQDGTYDYKQDTILISLNDVVDSDNLSDYQIIDPMLPPDSISENNNTATYIFNDISLHREEIRKQKEALRILHDIMPELFQESDIAQINGNVDISIPNGTRNMVNAESFQMGLSQREIKEGEDFIYFER